MKRRIATRIRRIISFALALMMMLVSTSIYAFAADTKTDDHKDGLECPTSVTYNTETGEVTYGADQTEELSDTSSYEIQYDEYSINPLYDGIIGLDNRVRITNTTDSPYRNICYIEAHFRDGTSKKGSGTLVYSDVLLTCGHAIYDDKHGGWAVYVTVTPAKNGENNNPLGSTYATNITSNEGWTVDGNARWDWAILDLKNGFDTWQLFGYYSDIYSQLGTSVTAIGYPGQEGFEYYMYADTNSITYVEEYIFAALCDVSEGESGGALIDVRSKKLIGIISRGTEITPGEEYANYFIRITPDICSRIQSHCN